MEKLDDLALENIWYFMASTELVALLSVCQRWRCSIINYLQRQGLVLNTLHWRDRHGERPGPSARKHRLRTLLSHVLPHMPNLKRLRITGCEATARVGLELVLDNCPMLESIDLGAFDINVGCLEELCKKCPRIREVIMPNKYHEDCLTAVLRGLPALTSLNTGVEELKEEHAGLLPSSLERLTCFTIDEDIEARLNTDLPNVHDIDVLAFVQCSVDLTACQSLKHIHIESGHYSSELPAGIEHVYHRYSLSDLNEDLHPSLQTMFLDSELPELSKLQTLSDLRCLKLANLRLSKQLLEFLPCLQRIKEIHLLDVSLRGVTDSDDATGDGSQSGTSEDDRKWEVLTDLAVATASLTVLGVITCQLELTEAQFIRMGHRLQQGRRLTLYTELDPCAADAETAWGYNLHETGRLRVLSDDQWDCDFPRLVAREW